MSDTTFTPEKSTSDPVRFAAPVFTATVFVGACLVFSVQPMFAKMVLPLLGGSASVWNVAMVFFQAMLLVGYFYAHLLQRIPSVKGQVMAHVAALAVGALFLPLGVAAGFDEPPATGQAFWLLGLFALSVGAPFAILSATAPLTQAWFARTGHKNAADPYFLYAASNLGSLLALLSYPLVLEPLFGVSLQSTLWAGGYAMFAVLILASGALAAFAQTKAKSVAQAAAASTPASTETLTWKRRAMWVLLAFVPSSLLVGTTAHISIDVAAGPLIWVVPLALYLLTFVVAFAKTKILPNRLTLLLQCALLVAAVAFANGSSLPWFVSLGISLGALFFTGVILHGRLVEDRPSAEHLTEFYIWMSVGGVLGGAFNALLAPMIFKTLLEYGLILVAAAALRPLITPHPVKLVKLGGIIAITLGLTGFVMKQFGLAQPGMLLILAAFVGIAAVFAAPRPFLFAGSLASLFAIGSTLDSSKTLEVYRSFYGVHKVMEQTIDGETYRLISHGSTIHGVQAQSPASHLRPASYYAPETPQGEVVLAMQNAGRLRSAAVIGMGAGSMACYARPGQSWTFYEIDPEIVHIARDSGHFSFLKECAPDARIVLGDGRLEIARQQARTYDFIQLDAFSSDSIPAHLLTREAVRTYADKLNGGGVIMAHISNRHLDLAPVLARVAAAEGLVWRVKKWKPEGGSRSMRALATYVVVMARAPEDLNFATDANGWTDVANDGRRAWTDDFTNIVEAMSEAK
jgi:hypothetical protein